MNKFDLQSSDLKSGEKVILNGIVRYHQDFSCWENEFDHVEFTVGNILDNGTKNDIIRLVAPGFGDLTKGGNYGNGAIYISKNVLLGYVTKEETK